MNKIKKIILGVLALFSFMGEGLWASQRDDDSEIEWEKLTKSQRLKEMQNLYNESYERLRIANKSDIINTLIKSYELNIELIRELFKGKLLILRRNQNINLVEESENNVKNALKRKFDNNIKRRLFETRFKNNFVIINISEELIESIESI